MGFYRILRVYRTLEEQFSKLASLFSGLFQGFLYGYFLGSSLCWGPFCRAP